MKELILILCVVFLLGLFSCGKENIRQEQKIKIAEKPESCLTNPENTYEIYIPELSVDSEKLPLVVIIDSHGNGKFALGKFRSAAQQYPAIFAASNLVKNGFENYSGAIQTLIDDVKQKYPVGETVFITGFSGGARMAIEYAKNHRVNGLLVCGALANIDQLNAVQCPVFSISGTDDFNFIETAQYIFQEQQIPANLKIELIHASHNWPDSMTLANALGFLYLSGNGKIKSSVEKSLARDYGNSQKSRIDSLKTKDDLIMAALVARNMSVTAPFSEDKTFTKTYGEIKSTSEYTDQLNQLKKSLQFETEVRQPYIEAFSTKDSIWWEKEIKVIGEKIGSEKNQFNMDMYKRIKAFWGIACYSFGNQAIKQKDVTQLKKIIAVYRMLEPENPYVDYFSAFLLFWEGDISATVSVLNNAKTKGFSDFGQLKTDFPAAIVSKIAE